MLTSYKEIAGLAHWTMSNKALRLAQKARELLELGVTEMPSELMADYEKEMDDLRHDVRVLTFA